ncbi:hypothetical protein QJ857_gp0249 [Tupanvirus soda lake]|uniref:Uncharacterized protein n=2 Tax=Tupanvirus TaxID=2094720 RepID=A0A6N1NWT8_9VIRU|nr:hypothetical protein QJ857_gp0249 [Tupanvirus soda lake]QKU35776.1 hypothetical protein [Tupanvirus soda lake]
MNNTLNNFYEIIKSPNFYVPAIISCIGLAILYLYSTPVQDRMKINLFSFGGIVVDWWSISHILLYIYFGYYFPNYFVEFLIIGIGWEIIENLLCMNPSNKKGEVTDDYSTTRTQLYSQKDEQPGKPKCYYWYGKLDDVVMNMIGFTIGSALAKKYRK